MNNNVKLAVANCVKSPCKHEVTITITITITGTCVFDYNCNRNRPSTVCVSVRYEDGDDVLDDKFQLKVPWNESMDKIGQKELCERNNDSKYSRVYEYWKWQLELYSSLCYGRHYSAIDHPILKEQLDIKTVFQ